MYIFYILEIIIKIELFVSYNNNIYPCKCRGLFRKEHIIPVVGDYVLFSIDKLLIEEVLPRKNIFNRPKVSNIDQAFLITSLKLPDLSLNLLDKFISLMEINHVKPIICITKSDLIDDEESVLKTFNDYKEDKSTKLVEFTISNNNPMANKSIMDANIPEDILVVMVKRKDKVIIPNGNTVIMPEDILVVTANDLKKCRKHGNSMKNNK